MYLWQSGIAPSYDKITEGHTYRVGQAVLAAVPKAGSDIGIRAMRAAGKAAMGHTLIGFMK